MFSCESLEEKEQTNLSCLNLTLKQLTQNRNESKRRNKKGCAHNLCSVSSSVAVRAPDLGLLSND